MPNEVLFGEPLLPTEKSTDDSVDEAMQPVDEDLDNEDYSQIAALVEEAGAGEERTLVVVPNFQHDLESIWWLTVYTVTARVAHKPSVEFAGKIFEHTIELGHHRAVFLEKNNLKSFAKRLHPDIDTIAGYLEFLRKKLFSQYEVRNEKRLKGDTAEDMESYAYIHSEFSLTFKALVDAFKLLPNAWNFPLVNEDVQEVVTPPQPRKGVRSARRRDDDDYRDESDEVEEESDGEKPRGQAKAKKLRSKK